METIFIISFIVLCFSAMILLEVNDSNKTWQMIVWRLLFVLSTLGSGISFVFVLTSKYDFSYLGMFLTSYRPCNSQPFRCCYVLLYFGPHRMDFRHKIIYLY